MRLSVGAAASGEAIDGPKGKIIVGLEPTDDMHDIFIGEPGSGDDNGMCKISGDSYSAKDSIKELPYGSDGTEWTGEHWQVSEDMTASLCSVLVHDGYDVCIDDNAVIADRSWGRLRKEIDVDDTLHAEEKLHLMAGPESPMEGVSRSWAEHAAEVGNFDTADEFVERFGLDVIEDDDAEDNLDNADEYKEEGIFSTDS